jgi:hypothetical protein
MFVLVAPQRDIGRRQREGAAVQHRVHVGRLLDVGAAVDLEVIHRARHAGRETAEEAAGQAVKRGVRIIVVVGRTVHGVEFEDLNIIGQRRNHPFPVIYWFADGVKIILKRLLLMVNTLSLSQSSLTSR